MYKHILLPTDGSELANEGVAYGLELAKLLGAQATVVTVFPPLDDFIAEGVIISVSDKERSSYRASKEKHLVAAKNLAQGMGLPVDTRVIENDTPWRAIVQCGDEIGADLIVMSSHGRRGLSAMILGSETQNVLTHATAPVLVYRGGG